jgi:hypothetical protein
MRLPRSFSLAITLLTEGKLETGGHMVRQQYRVKVTFRGVNEEKKLIQIPPGAVVRVVGDPEEGRFVAVQWQTRKLHVFLQDLYDRARPEQTHVARISASEPIAGSIS